MINHLSSKITILGELNLHHKTRVIVIVNLKKEKPTVKYIIRNIRSKKICKLLMRS